MSQTSNAEAGFLEMLRVVAARPAMYVGSANIQLVTSLLWGYAWGYDHGRTGRRSLWLEGESTKGFDGWLRRKYVINSALDWPIDRILLHHHDHDHAKAIAAIPALYEEFLPEKEAFNSKGFTEQDAELSQLCLEKYGGKGAAPNCSKCAKSE